MSLEVVVEDDSGLTSTPSAELFQTWLAPAWTDDGDASVSLKIVCVEEMADLNEQYRARSGPTNVLSFPAEIPRVVVSQLPSRPLGDIAICAAVVEKEAELQDKSLDAHWAHLAIHGFLHLLGHDHQESEDSEEMEALEIRILASLGFPNPYE